MRKLKPTLEESRAYPFEVLHVLTLLPTGHPGEGNLLRRRRESSKSAIALSTIGKWRRADAWVSFPSTSQHSRLQRAEPGDSPPWNQHLTSLTSWRRFKSMEKARPEASTRPPHADNRGSPDIPKLRATANNCCTALGWSSSPNRSPSKDPSMSSSLRLAAKNVAFRTHVSA